MTVPFPSNADPPRTRVCQSWMAEGVNSIFSGTHALSAPGRPGRTGDARGRLRLPPPLRWELFPGAVNLTGSAAGGAGQSVRRGWGCILTRYRYRTPLESWLSFQS